jgi:ABC-type uncharacterized transport system involved in gliding motility auxiliary subunit
VAETPVEGRSVKRSKRQRAAAVAAAIRASVLGAGVLVLFVLLAIVNYLGWKYHARFDWTETNIYTLSETTEQVLDELDDDIRVTVFITPGSRLYEPTRELLSRYEAESDRLAVRWLDPERNPVEAQNLIEEYEVAAAGVVFESGDDRRMVSADDLADLDFSAAQFGEQPEIAAYRGEERFTSALVALTQGEKPRIVFTTGHGELSLDDAGAGGLQAARDVLGPENVVIDEWASLGAARVPEGTDLVVIAGPQAAFTEDELAALGEFLAGGGRLLALLDPVIGPAASDAGSGRGFVDLGLQEWLADYGVHVGDDVVVDPSTTPIGFSAETFFATRYDRHQITRSLADGGIPVLVRHSRSVRSGSGPEGAETIELIQTGPDGWAVTSLGRDSYDEPAEGDLRGPVPLAVAVEAKVAPEAPDAVPDEAGDAPAEEERDPMRLVVIGDSDLATSAFLQMGPGNQTLVNNVFNWLVDREELVGIPPKRPEQVRLSMTPAQFRWSLILVLAGLPLLAVAAGFWVWSRRRRVR